MREQYSKLREINDILSQYENVNQRALDQYNQSKEKVEELRKEKERIDQSYEAIQHMIETLEQEKLQLIHLTFKQMSSFFRETFAELVPEGNAVLDMVYSDSTHSSGGSSEDSQSTQSSGGISTPSMFIHFFKTLNFQFSFNFFEKTLPHL
jgi:chromosome segregation ATPase